MQTVIRFNIARASLASVPFARPSAFEFSRSRSNSKYAKNDVGAKCFENSVPRFRLRASRARSLFVTRNFPIPTSVKSSLIRCSNMG
ncbi:unnamed protein product, partial [Iphiclides podalirius]